MPRQEGGVYQGSLHMFRASEKAVDGASGDSELLDDMREPGYQVRTENNPHTDWDLVRDGGYSANKTASSRNCSVFRADEITIREDENQSSFMQYLRSDEVSESTEGSSRSCNAFRESGDHTTRESREQARSCGMLRQDYSNVKDNSSHGASWLPAMRNDVMANPTGGHVERFRV